MYRRFAPSDLTYKCNYYIYLYIIQKHLYTIWPYVFKKNSHGETISIAGLRTTRYGMQALATHTLLLLLVLFICANVVDKPRRCHQHMCLFTGVFVARAKRQRQRLRYLPKRATRCWHTIMTTISGHIMYTR